MWLWPQMQKCKSLWLQGSETCLGGGEERKGLAEGSHTRPERAAQPVLSPASSSRQAQCLLAAAWGPSEKGEVDDEMPTPQKNPGDGLMDSQGPILISGHSLWCWGGQGSEVLGWEDLDLTRGQFSKRGEARATG